MQSIETVTAQHNARLKDKRFLRSMQFLQAKGFFFAYPRPRFRGKLCFADCIWAGRNVEPRILEVLPAAMLRFPGHFEKKIPQDVEKLLLSLRKGMQVSFEGVEYKRLRYWLDFALKDQRSVPLRERRILKVFRLKPALIEKLSAAAKRQNLSEAACVERMIDEYCG